MGDAIALADSRPGVVLGIAGSPGAGKSTLVEQLLAGVRQRRGADWAAHVPMDGFHLADEQLRRLGALERKGAPDTFDPTGYGEPARAGGRGNRRAGIRAGIRPHTRTATGRGASGAANRPARGHRGQLPAARPPGLGGGHAGAMDLVVVRDGPGGYLRVERLVARHVEFGKSPDAARFWVTSTDQRNADLVSPTAATVDLVIVNSADGWRISP